MGERERKREGRKCGEKYPPDFSFFLENFLGCLDGFSSFYFFYFFANFSLLEMIPMPYLFSSPVCSNISVVLGRGVKTVMLRTNQFQAIDFYFFYFFLGL